MSKKKEQDVKQDEKLLKGGFAPWNAAEMTVQLKAEVNMKFLTNKFITDDELYSLAVRYIRTGRIKRCGETAPDVPNAVVITIEVD